MRILALGLALLAAACSTTATDLTYSPALPPLGVGSPSIAQVTVADARDNETDPTYVGAIRSGVGSPLKTLVTSRPIADQVRTAFTAALRARHMLTDQGGQTLVVRVRKLSANQLVRREANAAFDLELQDRAGRVTYTDSVDVNRVNSPDGLFDAGVLASIADLRALMVQTMTEAIDRALDKPGLLAAARPGA